VERGRFRTEPQQRCARERGDRIKRMHTHIKATGHKANITAGQTRWNCSSTVSDQETPRMP